VKYAKADYLNEKLPINPQNSHREQWEVFAKKYDDRTYTKKMLREFSIFKRDNNMLFEGYCVFELINRDSTILNVISRE